MRIKLGKKRKIVGYASNSNAPNFNYWLLHMLAKEFGFDTFFFREKDIDKESKMINGWFPIRSGGGGIKTVQRKTSFPKIIDNIDCFALAQPNCYKEIYKESLVLRVFKSGSKLEQDKILRNSEFSSLAIQTYKYTGSIVDELLKKHKRIILKPGGGFGGKGIYWLSKDESDYILHNQKEEKKVSRENLLVNYDKLFEEQGFIVQPLLNFKTISGNSSDIRLIVARGKDGNCISLDPIVRVGRPNSIVTNMSSGGYGISVNCNTFFELEYGKDAKRIIKELAHIGKKLLDVFQKHYSKLIPSAGIDLGIDRDDNNAIKFIEINGCPGARPPILYHYMRIRCEFYDFMNSNYGKYYDEQQKSIISI